MRDNHQGETLSFKYIISIIMSLQTWTAFWNRYEIRTVQRKTAVKNYKPKRDYTALHKIGVNKVIAEQVYNKAKVFKDELFFNKFSRFFRKDPLMITQWFGAPSKTDAFEQLYVIVSSGNMANIHEQFDQLLLILKFYNRGQSRQYEGALAVPPPGPFGLTNLLRNLSRLHKNEKYRSFSSTTLNGVNYFGITKEGDRADLRVFKFIGIAIQANTVKIDTTMHSNKEYNIAKRALEKWLGILIDTPQSSKSLKKLENFLLSGESKNFLLTGVSFYDNNLKLTVSDIYNHPVNVSGSVSYQKKLNNGNNKIELISQFRLYHKGRLLARPVPVDVGTYRSAGIIGAVKLGPKERKLSITKKEELAQSFARDFDVGLHEFITYDDLYEEAIYEKFLEATTQRITHFELRSKLAMQIYQDLLNDKLVSVAGNTEEQTRFCVNNDCDFAFRPVWDRVTCSNCNQQLIDGKKFNTQSISEESIVTYLVSNFKLAAVTKLSNQLLKRPVYLARIEQNDDIVELLILNSALKDHQFEILKYRYPSLMIATALDNTSLIESKGINAVKVSALIFDCKKSNFAMLKQALVDSAANHLKHARGLCYAAVRRIADDRFYKKGNTLSKYFGAEMYEADVSALLNYVFGNCIWLGANYRGKKLPDGFTAFPLQNKKQGCFVWDGKFGEGRTLQMGAFAKNKVYIDEAKKNKSIRENGGLKAFVFISNKKFPKSFLKKYEPLTKGSNIKINFIKSEQLQSITNHFRRNEKLIYNNENAKTLFLDSMATLFFKVKKGPKTEIIDDTALGALLSGNTKAFAAMKQGKPFKV
jgi:hypothetical protein